MVSRSFNVLEKFFLCSVQKRARGWHGRDQHKDWHGQHDAQILVMENENFFIGRTGSEGNVKKRKDPDSITERKAKCNRGPSCLVHQFVSGTYNLELEGHPHEHDMRRMP